MTRPTEESRDRVRDLAAPFLERGDAVGWFDALYRDAGDDVAGVPWHHADPHPALATWLASERVPPRGTRTAVVGCGLGRDAEVLARAGLEVTAFDVSERAVEWARELSSGGVEYVQADLFALPDAWHRAFGHVHESHTLQALPPDVRARGFAPIADLVAPGGTLYVFCRGRDDHSPPPDGPPWALSAAELEAFESAGLRPTAFEDFVDEGEAPVRRFRAEYRRPG